MLWTNYAAFGLNVSLNKDIFKTREQLITTINTLKPDREMYHCYYDQVADGLDSLVGYKGMLRPAFDLVHLDLDSKDDGGEKAWEQTKLLVQKFREQNVGTQVYFSGNKGFHISIHKGAFGITEGPFDVVRAQIKAILFNLKKDYSCIDTAIFDSTRKFRAYRSQNKKTGLYKIRVQNLEWTLDEIKRRASVQPPGDYTGKMIAQEVSAWCASLVISTEKASSQQARASGTTKEIPQGQIDSDDSYKFRNFKSKKCIESMLEGTLLPQVNRHDIGLRLIYDQRAIGQSKEKCHATLDAWAREAYKLDSDCEQRVQDTLRMVDDCYQKPQDYKFGCYDDVKMAYCSATCKIYKSLDPAKRADCIDASASQKKQNSVARDTNPALKMSEGELADQIMKEMPELCKSNGQYFQWKGTHWHRIDGDMFEDSLIKVAMRVYGNKATIKKNKALCEHVIAKIPIAPESNHFFTSCPNKFNFTDCTAEVIQDGPKLRLETRAHRQDDYLAYCAPFPLMGEHNLPKGQEFKKYMDIRLQDGGEDSVRIIKQMLGAALIPYVPRIFFIEGITNAGKSTLAKLIMRLLGHENVSEVLPILRGGGADRFNWEPSIGKLANIVLELPKGAELDVNTLKMVRDKSPVSIDRKSQKHVKATLPFLHIYCCNQMPPSFEGNSGALNNRVSMLFFKPGYLNGSSGIVEYSDTIWNEDAGSVLEAARDGLRDLIESGFQYFNGEKSQEAVKSWQKMTDTIQQYFDEVNSGEWPGPQWEMKTFEKGASVFSDFKDWCTASNRKAMGKQMFYRELTQRFQLPRKGDAWGGERWDFASVIKNKGQKPRIEKTEQKPSELSGPEF